MAKKHVAIVGGIVAAAGAAVFMSRKRGGSSGSRENPVAEVRAGLDEMEGLEEAFDEEDVAASVRKPNRVKTR